MTASVQSSNPDTYASAAYTYYAATLTAAGGLVVAVMDFYLRFLLRFA